MSAEDTGLIHVYTGDGKGKTTASFGLALRAWGNGRRVYVLQFMKQGLSYGEVQGFRRMGIPLEQFGRGQFLHRDQVPPEDHQAARDGLARAREVLSSGINEMVILDEICITLDFGLLNVAEVREAIECRAPGVEVVLTGRNAPEWLREMADYVTEMRMVKHPFQRGVQARRGVEY